MSLGAVADTDAELTARQVFDAATHGDALAAKVVEDTAYYLAVGAMNLMHIIDPDLVVFGGGMVAAGEPFFERIRHHVRDWRLRCWRNGRADRSRGPGQRCGLYRRCGVRSAISTQHTLTTLFQKHKEGKTHQEHPAHESYQPGRRR